MRAIVRRKFLVSLILFLSFAQLWGCEKQPKRESEFIMGTFVEVVSNDPRAVDIVFSEFKRLESLFNLFDEESELARLNSVGSLMASSELFEVLKNAKEFYVITAGAFDVTVAPVSLLWKKAIKKQGLPADEDVKEALGLVGFDYVYLDEKTQGVRLLKDGSKIDLGGIAKGYALDKAVAKLKEANVSSALLNAGGELYALGENNGRMWNIAIQDPRVEKHLIEKMPVKNMAVATSGDYEQFFEFKNKRYSHIIDPKTGYPADSGIVSATVIAASATIADALATSFIILGREKAKELLKHFQGARAILIDKNGKVYEL